MFPTRVLQSLSCRLTLFIRPNCALCTNARDTLSNIWDRRHFAYEEIDVMKPGQEKWKNVYEFDTPVVHVEKNEEGETTTKARKLMHRFKEHEVEKLMDEAEAKAPSS